MVQGKRLGARVAAGWAPFRRVWRGRRQRPLLTRFVEGIVGLVFWTGGALSAVWLTRLGLDVRQGVLWAYAGVFALLVVWELVDIALLVVRAVRARRATATAAAPASDVEGRDVPEGGER